MSISILLATYNSEKYINDQLDSLFNQTLNDFLLYIVDDGSSDRTISIIKDYCKRYKNIIFLDRKGKGYGAMDNFMWLLDKVDSDYYMFCDHDDYWLPNKIELSMQNMKMMEEENKNKPIVICSDLVVVDKHLNVIDQSFWHFSKLNPNVLSKKKYLQTCNFVTGCTMLLNKKAKDVSFPLGDKALMHDYWVALKTVANKGIIKYINTPLILYRQHESNVLGAVKFGGYDYFFNKKRSFRSSYKSNKRLYEMVNQATGVSLFSFLIHRLIVILYRLSW